MKKLVVYYSYDGNTRLIAQKIADAVKADILEIKPEKEMTSKGFMKFVWGSGQVYMKKKPKILPLSKQPEDYDMIFIGTPVWAWAPAPPINTFLDSHMPKGKKVALFCSNEGNHGKTFPKMKESLEGSEVLGEQDFFAPLKKDRDKTLKFAMDWARSISPPEK